MTAYMYTLVTSVVIVCIIYCILVIANKCNLVTSVVTVCMCICMFVIIPTKYNKTLNPKADMMASNYYA